MPLIPWPLLPREKGEFCSTPGPFSPGMLFCNTPHPLAPSPQGEGGILLNPWPLLPGEKGGNKFILGDNFNI